MYANTFSFAGVTHDHNFFAENRRVEGCDPPCDKDDEGALDETDAQVGQGSPFVMDDMSPLAADSTASTAPSPPPSHATSSLRCGRGSRGAMARWGPFRAGALVERAGLRGAQQAFLSLRS